jgi:hypothetical protein
VCGKLKPTTLKKKLQKIKTMISVGQIIALAICVGALVTLPKVITHFGQKNNDKVETAE